MIRMCSKTALIGAFCMTSACTTVAQSAADIEIISETGTSLSVKFTDAEDNNTTISFGRPTTNDVWLAQSSLLTTGDEEIVFGNDEPEFATSVQLRALSISASAAIQTFGSGIANSEFDDITIYRLAAGDSAIALWQEGSITEIHFAGDFVKDVLAITGPTFCGRTLELCCRRIDIDPEPETGPIDYPWPNNLACRAVIQHCPETIGDAACECLRDACEYCFDYPTICSATPGLQGKSEDACVEGTNLNCDGEDPGPDDPENPIVLLIKEMSVRLQALIDVATQGP